MTPALRHLLDTLRAYRDAVARCDGIVAAETAMLAALAALEAWESEEGEDE